jgi:hypothetical protein
MFRLQVFNRLLTAASELHFQQHAVDVHGVNLPLWRG